MINLKSDMSPVTNDLARVAAGRVLGLGQTVISNTNTGNPMEPRWDFFSYKFLEEKTRKIWGKSYGLS